MSYLGPVSSNQDGTIINYIPYGTIENNTTRGWSACTLTWSGTTPSGAPTLTATQMAISASSTDPLSSLYSLLLTKSAANAQYQGFVSDAFTIKREDLAKVLTGSFYYEVASGTVDMSGTSTQSLEIWVYNVNANQWIQPAGYRGLNQSSGPGLVSFTFQTDSTPANNSYRIAVITQQTSATAYTVKFDNFKLSPQTAPIVQLRNPVGTIIATGSLTPPNGYLYCNGALLNRSDYAELFAAIGTTYNTGGETATQFRIPDLRGIFARGAGTNPSNANNTTTIGARQLDAFGSHSHDLTARTTTDNVPAYWPQLTNTSRVSGGTTYAANSYNFNVSGAVVANGSTETRPANVGVAYHICFSSGNVQTSDSTDTRVVAFNAYDGAQVAITNTTAVLPLGTTSVDTHAVRSGNTYVIPVSGFYRLSAKSTTKFSVGNTTFTHALIPYKNGVAQFGGDYGNADGVNSANLEFYYQAINSIFSLNAGDIIDFRYFTDYTGVATTYLKYCSVERLSGPSVVAASETVACHVETSASPVLATGAGSAVSFPTKVYDTHNSFSGNTYTVPVSGKYRITALLTIVNTSGTSALFSDVYVNGSLVKNLACVYPYLSNANNHRINGSVTIQLTAGQTVQLFGGTGNAIALYPSGIYNYFIIERVGN